MSTAVHDGDSDLRATLPDRAGFRAPTLAWPTLLLGACVLIAYGAIVAGAITGVMSLSVACALQVVVVYLAYTPLHEAVHGNIAERRPWVGELLGVLVAVPLLFNLTLHRSTHLAHHGHLNDPERDADHWVAGSNPLAVLLRCATVVFAHFVVGVRLNRGSARGRGVLVRGFAENLLSLTPMLAVGMAHDWTTAFYAQILPALLGVTLLGFLFDWLPHHPHRPGHRLVTTRLFFAKGPLHGLVTALYCGQNLHLVHHLDPRVPFYRYSTARESVIGRATRAATPRR